MILRRMTLAIVFSVSDIALAQSLILSLGKTRMITPLSSKNIDRYMQQCSSFPQTDIAIEKQSIGC